MLLIIVAATLGGLVHWGAGRLGAHGSLTFGVGLFVALLVYATGGAVVRL